MFCRAGALIVVACGLLAAAPSAHAVSLNTAFGADPFKDTSLGGTTSAARPELAATVVEDVIQPFSLPGITGWVQNRVVRENVAGTLDFYWRVTVDPTSSGGAVDSFRLGDFGYSNITDADWRIDGLGSAAPYVGRLFNPAGRPDGAINFLFTDPAVGPADPFSPTGGSRFFFLHTSATDYAKTATYDLTAPNVGISAEYKTFAPVPEPSTLVLAACGMLAAFGASRLRRVR